MNDYNRFLDVLMWIEDADRLEGWISFYLDSECDGGRVYAGDMKIMAAQFRKLEKERDELQDKLDPLKRRIEDTLEDF